MALTIATPQLWDYASMDGSSEKLTHAMDLMGDFCRENRKAPS
jgi:hypothetical protein